MGETTQSAVLLAPRQIEHREFDIPPTRENDGLLRVEATGICSADWNPYAYGGEDRYPFKHLFPWILGHEIVGHVERIGVEAAKRWKVTEGDRVVVEEVIPCGHCRLCRTGWYRGCTGVIRRNGDGKFYGMTPVSLPPYIWGGYGYHVYLHPNAVVHKLPDSVPTEVAPLFIPVANGFDWLQQAGRSPVGATVVILGPGQHGLGCVVGARESGAGTIIVVGKSGDDRRLEAATALGADHVINADHDDVVGSVSALTNGEMADIVMDVTPSPEAVNLCLDLVPYRGVIVMPGFKTGKTVANFSSDKLIGRTLVGAASHDVVSVSLAIDLIATARYPLDLLATHRFPLSRCEDALRTVGGETEEDPIHVTIIPD